jgi:hypothetical protein
MTDSPMKDEGNDYCAGLAEQVVEAVMREEHAASRAL